MCQAERPEDLYALDSFGVTHAETSKLRKTLDEFNGKILQGQPFSILVKSDSIELSGMEIFYSELAQWIEELHSLSSNLAVYKEQ